MEHGHHTFQSFGIAAQWTARGMGVWWHLFESKAPTGDLGPKIEEEGMLRSGTVCFRCCCRLAREAERSVVSDC